MNREERRRLYRKLDKSKATGEPWELDGLTGGCSDCDSETVMVGQGGRVMVGILHDESCPVLSGHTPWRPAS